MILAGDIGATKTYLGLFTKDLTSVAEAKYASREYANLEELIRYFLKQTQFEPATITAVCMGVAGPVVEDRCELTNINWTITVAGLRQLFDGVPAALLNDLEAIGYGVPRLSKEELIPLNPDGISRVGNVALIAAGTGLGEALLYWDKHTHAFYPSPSEGSHVDFAPRNDEEIELLRYLMQGGNKNVSYEQVVSGFGLVRIYEFLKNQENYQEPAWLTARLGQGNPAAVISEVAIAKENPLCEKALDIFVSIYGAEAGNLALKYLALGGVYVGGGIVLKILDKLSDGTFMRAFTNKEGHFAQLNASIPVYVICNAKVGLLGAAWYAMKL